LEDGVTVAERLLRLQIHDAILECFRLPAHNNLLGIEAVNGVQLLKSSLITMLLYQLSGSTDVRLSGALLFSLRTSGQSQNEGCNKQGNM